MDMLADGRRAARPAALPVGSLASTRDGEALAAAVRPASREAGESYQSRIWRFGLDGSASAADPRAERRRLCRAARRSTTGSPSPPIAPCKGKADRSSSSTMAAARPLGDDSRHGRGSALDQRRRGADRARRRSRPRRRRHQRRDAPGLGRAPRIPRSQPERGAAAALQGRRRRRRDRRGRPCRSQRLGVRSARRRRGGRARLGRSERARLVSRRARPDRFRDARGEILHRSRWQLQAPCRSPVGRARRLPRRLVERSRPRRRARSASSISRPASVTTLAADEASNVTTLAVARRGEPLVRRLVAARLGLWRHRPRRQRRWIDARRRDHRPQQLPRRRSRRRRTRPGFAAVRETVGEPPEIVLQERRRTRTGSRSRS